MSTGCFFESCKSLETNHKPSWALFYARELGTPVFPLYETDGEKCSCGNSDCKDQGKHPRTTHGVKDATTNENKIRRWWKIWSDANIGMRMGEVSNTICLDCDTPEAEELVLKHAPDAPSQRTGSGGRQFFFEYIDGMKNWQNVLGLGLDIRTNNGYTVLPPSSNKNGRYEWIRMDNLLPLPKGLRDAILESRKKEEKAVRSTSKKVKDALDYAAGPSPSWDSVKHVLDSIRERFSEEEVINDGNRHNRLLEIGGSLRGRGVPEESIVLALRWINESLCAPPLGSRDFDGIVESVMKIKREVNALVDDFEIWLDNQVFEDKTGATNKKVVKTILAEARKFGRKGQKGLDLTIALLDLKDKAKLGYKTVQAAVHRIAFIEFTKDENPRNASTITILYPNGTEVDNDGEVVVTPFARVGDNSNIYTSNKGTNSNGDIEGKDYSCCPLRGQTVDFRWGEGRLGLSKEDLLNAVLKNIGIGVEFGIKDLGFYNRNDKFKRRHLEDLANPKKFGLVKRVRRGVYVVPDNFFEDYEHYKEKSGENYAEERELEKTSRRRAGYHYRLEVRDAIEAGQDPEEVVSVPEVLSDPEVARTIYTEWERAERFTRASKFYDRYRKRGVVASAE